MKAAILLAIPLAAPAAVTFNRDIAPIVFSNCAPCHRPGEAGPFVLLTYQDVRKRASQIAAVTSSRYMPPWLPEPGFGDFAGERRLSKRQIELIRRWVDQGAPEGDAADLPPLPAFPEGWQLRTPDLVLKAPQPYILGADRGDVFRNLVIPVPLKETRYVSAVEIRPGDKRIVHHANLMIDRSGSARKLDGQDGQAGFPGMFLRFESDVFDPDSHFLFWKPGTVPWVEPADMAWRLDPGADLVLNLHLQPSGKPETVQPMIGLYFTDQPPARFPMLIQLEHDGVIDIPPGSQDFMVTDTLRLPADVDVLGVYPHAHYLGKELRGFATLPGGEKKWLISIRHWDLNWQAVYRYRSPVFLPAGTVVEMRYTYDNSSANPKNPNTPPQRVVAGNASTDEMGHLWLQVLPRGPGDRRLPFQQALMQRRLEKYPGDYTASFNLGAVLLRQGQADAALGHFRDALRARPQDAIARNGAGAALESLGKLEEAVQEFRRVLESQPGHVNARYNLANCLAEQGRLAEAIEQYREIVRAHPGDSAARTRLLASLQAAGQEQASAESMRYLRDAVELAPDDADAHTNLGAALARKGDLASAEAEFESALRINPGHAVARKNMELLRARVGKQRE